MDLSKVLEIVTRSDAGLIRAHNEDAVFANPALGLAILADGMGGYNAGEVASSMATTVLGGELERALVRLKPYKGAFAFDAAHDLLETRIAAANAAIYEAAQGRPEFSGMGTTLVMALFFDDTVAVAHIGDSRLYRLRHGHLELLTKDHSLLQEQLDSGMITPDQARFSQNKNLVTRALGVDPTVEPEIRDYETARGDLYLLCSDGLNDMLEDEEIGATLRALSGDLGLCASRLVQMANDKGGRDNVSVILVRIKNEYPAAQGWLGWLERLTAWLK